MQIKNDSRMPNVIPAKTSKMWWRYSSNRDKLTLTAHANNGGQNKYGSGSSAVKKSKMKNAREAWPDGKANLSGPMVIKLSSIVGRLRRVAALILATKITSNIRPINKFI